MVNVYNKLKNNNVVNYISKFFNSPYFFIFCLSLSLISSIFSFEFIIFYFYTILIVFSFFFLDSLKCVPVILVSAFFSLSRKGFLNGYFILDAKENLIQFIILASIVVLAFILRFILKKEYKTTFTLKGKLTYPLLVLVISFLFAGIFSKEYTFVSFLISLVKSFSFAFIYFYFIGNCSTGKKEFNYYAIFAVSVSILIIVQLAILFLTDPLVIEGGAVNRDRVDLEWGGHNSIGGILAFLMPFTFYYAFTNKRGYLFTLLALVELGAILLTMSRLSILVAGAFFVVASIILLIKSKGTKKVINAIIFGVLVVIAVAILVVFKDKFINMFSSIINLGFSGNGRIELYKRGIADFLENPIFGVGYDIEVWQGVWDMKLYFGKYHNFIIEFMATSGVLGIIAMCYLGYSIFKIFYKNCKGLNAVMVSVMLIMTAITFMDRLIFAPCYTIVYMLVIAFAEKNTPKKIKTHENSDNV